MKVSLLFQKHHVYFFYFYGTAWKAFSYCLGPIACFSKHGVLLSFFFCDFTFSFTGEKIHTIYILAFSAQRGQKQKNGES
jgi:hypothetical protein